MQKFQVDWNIPLSLFAPVLLKQMKIQEKQFPRNPRTVSHKSSALATSLFSEIIINANAGISTWSPGNRVSIIIFPSCLGSSQISRENSSRTLLATYFWELEKGPVLCLVFENKMARNSRSSRLGFGTCLACMYLQTYNENERTNE